MSAITIGNCSPCCVSFNNNETQTVRAAVLFKNLGWSGLTDYVPATYLPNVTYLKKNSFQEDATGIFYQQITELDQLGNIINDTAFDHRSEHDLGYLPISAEWTYDGYGNLVKFVHTYPNGRDVQELSNPFTYDAARAAAIALLDVVDLINPLRVYDFTNYDFYGTPTTEATRLLYASEYSRYSEAKSSQAFVYRDIDGQTLISREQTGWNYLTGQSMVASDYAAPGLFAMSGVSNTANSVNSYLDGLVWAGKSAHRTSTGFGSRTDAIKQRRGGTTNRLAKRIYSNVFGVPNTDFYTVVPLPGIRFPQSSQQLQTPILSGEHIFLPADVPGAGASTWSA